MLHPPSDPRKSVMRLFLARPRQTDALRRDSKSFARPPHPERWDQGFLPDGRFYRLPQLQEFPHAQSPPPEDRKPSRKATRCRAVLRGREKQTDRLRQIRFRYQKRSPETLQCLRAASAAQFLGV